ncbi:MAG: hypothetical protein IH945_01155, partial [Armatimonadetes bacterium]|nr:hypothetical protein [Armatimonadota bacterium]
MLTSVAILMAASLAPAPAGVWSVNSNNTLIWDGRPYMPVGARVAGNLDAIRRALDAGIEDLVVELPANGAGWDEALAELNDRGARWFLAVSSAAPTALGTVVEPHGYRMDLQGKQDVSLSIPGAERALVVIADKRSAAIRSYGTHSTAGGILAGTFDSQVATPHVLLVYPVVRNLSTPDFWEGFDAHRDALLAALQGHDLGDGLRGLIDPLGGVARFPTPDIRFVPNSPIFAIEMESFLRDKYVAVSTCVQSWSIAAHDIESFEQLARLVPLWSESKGVEQLWDPVKDRLYASSRGRSTAWTDVRSVIRTAAIRRYSRLVDSIHRIVDVPVLQTWGGWTGPYDGTRTGLAGVGLDFRARSMADVIESASRPLSTVLSSGFEQVFMVTGIEIEFGDRLSVETVISELKGMGARGWFVRTEDETLLESVAAIARRQRLDDGDADWKPQALFYPEAARNPAAPVRLYGGTWMLPSPAPGNRLELGSMLNGYYYGGFPKPYTVIWARGEPVKTKLYLINPKAVDVRALDDSEVRIRVRGKYIELEITSVPLEAERATESNFSEPRFIPGASSGRCLVLDSKMTGSTPGFFARFSVRSRIEGEHEMWLAADIPPALRDHVSLRVGGVVLRPLGPPVSYYGLNLAWYRFGKAELGERTNVTV